MAYSRVRRLHSYRWRGAIPFMLSALVLAAVACSGGQSVANKSDTDYMDQQTAILSRGQPLHLYDYSQDRASFIAIYDARVQGKATYSVSVPQNGGGRGWYECPSRGYPIPADTQLTNPERLVNPYNTSYLTVPQAEPNGTFSGGGASGTYMQCVDTDGSLYTVYSEPPVMTFPFAVAWKGDHYEKANPNDRASFALPTPPVTTASPQTFVYPTPAATAKP